MSLKQKNIIGSAIRHIRTGKGLTQKALAGQVGISPQHLGKWERGEMTPHGQNLVLVADALGTSVDKMLGLGRLLCMGPVKGAMDTTVGEQQEDEGFLHSEIKTLRSDQKLTDAERTRLTVGDLRYILRSEIADDPKTKLLIEYSEKILTNQERLFVLLEEVLLKLSTSNNN